MLNQAIYAFFGGFAAGLLQLAEVGKIPKPQRPDFKDFLYWLPYILWPLFGAGLVCVYYQSNITLNPILSLNIGASAPLILKTMLSAAPKRTIDPGEGA